MRQSSDVIYRRNLIRVVKEVKNEIDEKILAVAKNDILFRKHHLRDSIIDDIDAIIISILSLFIGRRAETVYRSFIEKFIVLNEERANILDLTTEKERINNALNEQSQHTGNAMDVTVVIPKHLRNEIRNASKSLGQKSIYLSTEMKAIVERNVDLITSIPKGYLEQVREIVLDSQEHQYSYKVLENKLRKQFNVTKSRANLIARDQTNKILGQRKKDREIAAGREYFQWIDSQDTRVRTRHTEIAEYIGPWGKGIYRWDQLPLSKDNEHIYPGWDYQCRCTAKGLTLRELNP